MLPFTADSADTWLSAGNASEASKDNRAKHRNNFLAICTPFESVGVFGPTIGNYDLSG
jgi:hypothetical protein